MTAGPSPLHPVEITRHGGRLARSGDALGLTAFLVYAGALGRGIWIGTSASDSFGAISIVGMIVVGYVLADLISGIVHWMGDTFGTETTPIAGARFIAPFREHHVNPTAMVEHGVLELVGNTAIVSLPAIAAVFHLAHPADGGTGRLALSTLVLATLVGTLLTNLLHRWAHVDEPPHAIALLQRWGLVLTPEHHDRHHSEPFDRWYCITTGWADLVIERIDLFRRLERFLK